MTEIEELVTLILPELMEFLKQEDISGKSKKELDNKAKPSIHWIEEETRHD